MAADPRGVSSPFVAYAHMQLLLASLPSSLLGREALDPSTRVEDVLISAGRLSCVGQENGLKLAFSHFPIFPFASDVRAKNRNCHIC